VAFYEEMKMKQGKSSETDFRKREPIPKAVHETAVSELGRSVQYTKSPFYGGQGLKPPGPSPSRAGPGGGRTIHPHGTQGKHK
jgi:hypothetical protein